MKKQTSREENTHLNAQGRVNTGGKHQVIRDQVRLTSNSRKNKARVNARKGNLQNKTGNTIAAHDMTEIQNTNYKG